MTTPLLSAVTTSPSPPPRVGGTDTSSSGNGGFSAVLSGESARQQASVAAQRQASGSSGHQNQSSAASSTQQQGSGTTSGGAAGQPAGSQASSANGATHGKHHDQEADTTTAQQAAEHGLALPQIALNIAAEVAAVKGGKGGSSASQQALAGLAGQVGAQGQSEAAIGENAASNLAATLSLARNARSSRLGNDTLQTNPANTPNNPSASTQDASQSIRVSANVLASMLTPMPATAPGASPANRAAGSLASPTGQEARLAGMKQALATAHQRLQASLNGTETNTAPDFFTALANAKGVATDPVASRTLQHASVLTDTTAAQAAALQASAQPGAGAVSTSPPQAQGAIAVPLASPQWGVELGKQFVSIAQGTGSKPHTIELRLDPPDLGPLRISISLHDNTAQAAFVSPHAVVRQTVENALPQLQQALAQAGISLGQASVSDQGQPQQAFGQEAGNTGSNSNSGNGFSLDAASGVATAGPALAVSSRTLNPNTLVDTFA